MSALGAPETEAAAMLDGRPPIAPGRVPGGGKGRGFAVIADAAVDGAAGAAAIGALAAAAGVRSRRSGSRLAAPARCVPEPDESDPRSRPRGRGEEPAPRRPAPSAAPGRSCWRPD